VKGIAVADDERDETTALGRLQAGLFSRTATPAGIAEDVVILSAPGESRECVEIARLLQQEAERGTKFDQMAILLRSPQQYRAHLEEALRRASIPAHFARGTIRPDPGGRAFLALLACLAEGLSARRFAEYLSLGEVADAGRRGHAASARARERTVGAPDEESVPEAVVRAAQRDGEDDLEDTDASSGGDGRAASTVEGTLRAPRLWERLLVDAAVIGGRGRWRGGSRASETSSSPIATRSPVTTRLTRLASSATSKLSITSERTPCPCWWISNRWPHLSSRTGVCGSRK